MGAKKAPVEERANRVPPDIDFLRLRKSEYQIRTSKNLIRPVCRGERTPFGATRLDHFLTGEKIYILAMCSGMNPYEDHH